FRFWSFALHLCAGQGAAHDSDQRTAIYVWRRVSGLDRRGAVMSARKNALETILRLASEHNISADEIAAGLSAQRTPDAKKNMLGRLFNYIGGIFIFSGIGLLTSFIWEDIGSAQRVILTFGVGLAAFVMGIAALKDARFEKASTPL